MALIRSWSKAARQASGGVFLNILDGEPPELVTRIRSRPGRAQIAVTDDVTVPESVTSSVSCRTSQFVIFCICGALSSRMLADRVQKATCAPSEASPSGAVRPIAMGQRQAQNPL